MKLAGNTVVGNTPIEIVSDTKRVGRYRFPQAGNIAKGSLYLDGLGAGVGAGQACRMLVYDALDNLIATSDEVMVENDQAPGWVDFGFSAYGGELALPAGDFFAGVHGGGYSNIARVYSRGPEGMGGKWNADTYSDGASSPFGAATAVTADLSCFLTYFTPYATLRPYETALYFSRLPVTDAQDVLALGGPETDTSQLVTVGWHYTSVDDEQGSNALVRPGSDATAFVGSRIRVATIGGSAQRAVAAYVHGVGPDDLEWDVSLTRSLYARLAPLASDPFTAVAMVIGDPGS